LKDSRNWILGIIAIALCAIAFFLGKWTGKRNANAAFIENYTLVKEITELGALEVQANAAINLSNYDGKSWYAPLQHLLLEQTVNIEIPYIAKYGCSFDHGEKLSIKQANGEVNIELPEPQLLSLEMRLDRMQLNEQKGWLVGSDPNLYKDAEKQLYEATRKGLEKNPNFKQAAKNRLIKLMKEYFAPSGEKVNVSFVGTVPVKG
jgi:hypothetical protein